MTNSLADATFPDAAEFWLGCHERHIRTGTIRDYKQCIRSLRPFFENFRLRDINIEHFESYQKLRTVGEGWKRAAGPSRINHELNTLSQILARAGLWSQIAPQYKALRLPRPKVGCALSPEDEERLFRIAASRPRWKVAYFCSILTANTTAGPGEIRHLRLCDIDPSAKPEPMIHVVEGAKNEYRVRPIPLNEAATLAVTQLLERARKLGACQPDHYLLPHRARNGAQGFDPTRPMYDWRGAWEKLRTAAGMPHLRMYDLRHHAITRMLEDENVSERTVIEIAGHVSRQMLERYSHIRTKSKADAVRSLSKGAPVQPQSHTQPYFSLSSTTAFMLGGLKSA